MPQQNKILWLFVSILIAFFIFPKLVQDGMFLDGLLYSTVSNNLAQGSGTFWRPDGGMYFGFDGPTPFWEHPPLNYWLQAWLYKLLPNSIYPERIFVALLLIGHLILIRSLWKLASRKMDISASLSGWPILLYILIPLMIWSYETNIQEHSLTIFALLSVYFTLKGSDTSGINKYILPAGIFCFLATFSKGVPGFFPLAAPVLFWIPLRGKKFRSAFLESSLILAIVASIYGILYQFQAPATWMKYYINNRLLKRIAENPTVSSHFHILEVAISQLAIPLGLCLLLFLWKKSETKWTPKSFSFAIAFILIGLSATLPLMLTKVQRGFYMDPAFPFFVLGLAIWSKPYLEKWLQEWPEKWMARIQILLASLVFAGLIFTFTKIGKVKRDKEKLADVHTLGALIEHGESIQIGQSLQGEHSFKVYLIRHYYLNAHSYITVPYDYYIRKKNTSDKIPEGFKRVPQELKYVELFKKQID